MLAGKGSSVTTTAGKGSMPITAGKLGVRVKVAGKASTSTKPRVRAKRAGKPQPFARCITGYFCSTCKPDYNMALAMGTHGRLGEASPLANLTDDLLRQIIEATKPRRTLPAWMSCGWKLTPPLNPLASSPVCSTDQGQSSCRESVLARATRRPSQTAQET